MTKEFFKKTSKKIVEDYDYSKRLCPSCSQYSSDGDLYCRNCSEPLFKPILRTVKICKKCSKTFNRKDKFFPFDSSELIEYSEEVHPSITSDDIKKRALSKLKSKELSDKDIEQNTLGNETIKEPQGIGG